VADGWAASATGAPPSTAAVSSGGASPALVAALDYAPPQWPGMPSPMAWQRWVAILITSLAFAAVHGQLWLMPPIFFLSLCLGYAYERTGNLWVPMIVHACFNASSTVLFLLVR